MTIELQSRRCARLVVPFVLLFRAIHNSPAKGAEAPILPIPTRFGDIAVMKNEEECCSGWIQ